MVKVRESIVHRLRTESSYLRAAWVISEDCFVRSDLNSAEVDRFPSLPPIAASLAVVFLSIDGCSRCLETRGLVMGSRISRVLGFDIVGQ